MGKLMWTMIIILLFGCSPDSAKSTQDDNNRAEQNSSLNDDLDDTEKLRRELEATQRAMV